MSAVSLDIEGGEALQRVLQSIADRAGKPGVLRAGFLENADYPDGLHVAQVAFWNEFGTSTAPARPFFRQTIQRHSRDWGSNLGKALKATNFDKDKSLVMLGTEIKDEIVESIASWPADNAPSTVKRKGFNHGLVESSKMQNSADFEVSGGR